MIVGNSRIIAAASVLLTQQQELVPPISIIGLALCFIWAVLNTRAIWTEQHYISKCREYQAILGDNELLPKSYMWFDWLSLFVIFVFVAVYIILLTQGG